MSFASRQQQLGCLSLAVLLAVLSLIQSADAQGLIDEDFSIVGSSNVQAQKFRQLYPRSLALKDKYRKHPKASCAGGQGIVCASGSQDENKNAELLLATSPAVFDSANPELNAGFSCIGPARNQKPCNTCASEAVIAAAEAATACVSRLDASSIRMSEQDHYFCGPGEFQRLCDSGWRLSEALQQLVNRGSSIVKYDCLKYAPDPDMEYGRDKLCHYTCKDQDPVVVQGKFSVEPISSTWVAQRHIRRFGAVVTSMVLYPGFQEWFNKTDIYAIYKGPSKPDTKPMEGHAVVVHGYNNEQGYWNVLTSWGPNFADHGSFKIAYGVAGLMAPGETYGIKWTPIDASKFAAIVEPTKGRAGCFEYMARPGDSLSRVSEAMWGPGLQSLQKLLVENVKVITELDGQLLGKTLTICDPAKGAVFSEAMQSQPRDAPDCKYSDIHLPGASFELASKIAKSAGKSSYLGFIYAANPLECCRLCVSTPRCQLWSFESGFLGGCTLYKVGAEPLKTFHTYYTDASAGIVTLADRHVTRASSTECGAKAPYLLQDIALSGGNVSDYKQKKVKAPSWQECCRLMVNESASHGGQILWTWTYTPWDRVCHSIAIFLAALRDTPTVFKQVRGAITGIWPEV